MALADIHRAHGGRSEVNVGSAKKPNCERNTKMVAIGTVTLVFAGACALINCATAPTLIKMN